LNKTVHIRKNKLRKGNKKTLPIKVSGGHINIPTSQIVSRSDYKSILHKGIWCKIVLTDWIYNKIKKLSGLKGLSETYNFYVEEDYSFSISWDAVIERTIKSNNKCFYCNDNMINGSTREHIVPRSLLKALGLKNHHHNIVKCCLDCNKAKGHFSLPEFKMVLEKRLSEESNNKKVFKLKHSISVINKLINYGHSSSSSKRFKI
jgi:hypothetical protein